MGLFGPMAVATLVGVLVEQGELVAAGATLDEWDVGLQAPESLQAQLLRQSRAVREWPRAGRRMRSRN